jgi:hypothetical protein
LDVHQGGLTMLFSVDCVDYLVRTVSPPRPPLPLRIEPLNRTARLIFLFALATAAFSLPSVAQVADPPTSNQVSSPNAEKGPELTLTDIEAALAAVEEDSGIDETVKGALRVKFQQAIAAMKDATANSEKATEFCQAMTQAPIATAQLREQLQELPAAESVADSSGNRDCGILGAAQFSAGAYRHGCWPAGTKQ